VKDFGTATNLTVLLLGFNVNHCLNFIQRFQTFKELGPDSDSKKHIV
jgi:hypothetical protein